MPKKTIDQIEVASKRVLMRVDFNVPLDSGGAITDDRRIRQSLPSIQSVTGRKGRLVLMSHLGRPEGAPEAGLSLEPAAKRLAELVSPASVRFVGGDCVAPAAAAAVAAMGAGEIVVLENLRFVQPGLTAEDARAGFEELACTEILDALSDGLETDVGERGANLSEGERQIVCFVRALLADPAILILDEATSAVDTRTEALILRALRRLSHHQTTVIIAHRLSTIRDADTILVMKHGTLVEQGIHAELLAKGGVYTELYSEYAG